VFRKSSWLTERLGQPIASPIVTIVDEGRLPGGIGTSPWDGEGVPTRRNVLVERGMLAMFEYDTYFARRAGTRSTGNAVRSTTSVPGIGCHNLLISPGEESAEQLLRRVDRGFYLDDTGSFGFNAVTGDYSFQAQGFWIENGVKAYPVDGVTVASTSLEMLKRVAAIANDARRDGSVSSPSLLIEEMTISGE
jgi:PmbA protein